MSRHLAKSDRDAGLAHILASPADNGLIEGLVVRPEPGFRREVARCPISLIGGMAGDHWVKGCWTSTEDSRPHPDVQICIMNAPCIALIAQGRDSWAPAGDNVFVDMDLTPENLPAWQRLAVGSAIIEITDTPHTGCQSFIDRYGRNACVFVNVGKGRKYGLRGVYAGLVRDGEISVGDRMTKLG